MGSRRVISLQSCGVFREHSKLILLSVRGKWLLYYIINFCYQCYFSSSSNLMLGPVGRKCQCFTRALCSPLLGMYLFVSGFRRTLSFNQRLETYVPFGYKLDRWEPFQLSYQFFFVIKWSTQTAYYLDHSGCVMLGIEWMHKKQRLMDNVRPLNSWSFSLAIYRPYTVVLRSMESRQVYIHCFK